MTPAQVSNPPNPWSASTIEWLDEPPPFKLHVYEETAKSIVARNQSPDIGFGFSVNPYRGCFHGCAYCYARPTHQYLDLGAGTDFERKIVVKTNAAELLKREFEKRSWQGDEIVFSGVTDCYQPLEASYEITRACLKVCLEYKNPVAIITKGALIRRDLDILSALNRVAKVTVITSLAFSDDKVSRRIEPYAPRPSIRLRAMKELCDAGIPVGVGVAPVIPGLNDSQIPEILERAYDAGARFSFLTLLRLPLEVKPVFIERLEREFPDRAKKVLSQVAAMKGGVLNRSEFGTRMHGDGPQWQAIEWLYEQTCRRLGMNIREESSPQRRESTFERPISQLSLF
ncbi:MAG: PA0069 family radical SAM protein [Deltaproteobacteria bacterium]|nr:PA0069 family radical SAM protein [Deltaproteobacteria bacterium]